MADTDQTTRYFGDEPAANPIHQAGDTTIIARGGGANTVDVEALIKAIAQPLIDAAAGGADLGNLRTRFNGTTLEFYDNATPSTVITSSSFASFVNNNATGEVIRTGVNPTLSNGTLSIPTRNSNGQDVNRTVDLNPLLGTLVADVNNAITGGSIAGNIITLTRKSGQSPITIELPTDVVLAIATQQQSEDGTDNETAMSPLRVAQRTANLFEDARLSGDGRTLTITRRSGNNSVVIELPESGGGGGGTERSNDFTDAELADNVITLTRASGNDPITLDLTPYVNQTAQQISDALFNSTTTALMNFEDQPFPITGGDFQDQGGGQIDRTLGTLTPEQATAITNGTVTRVSGTITWTVGEHQGVLEPSAQAEIRYGTLRIGGISLIDEQEISFNFQITPNAVANATGRDITVTAIARTRGGAAPNSNLSITNAQLHLPGPGYNPVETIAIAAAQHATAPLGVKIADNLEAIHQNTARIGTNETAIAAQDTRITENTDNISTNVGNISANTTEIAVLKQRTSFTPSAAAMDLLRRALEVHMAGATTYVDPFTRVTRWQVGTGLSLDTTGITINTTQRRALYGLGERLDKIYYFRTVTAAEHMGYIVRGGGDQAWFGVDPTANVWQMYNPDEGVGLPAGRKNVTHSDHPSGVPYVAGDIFGYQPETLPNGGLRLVPVIQRAAGGEPLQCNDVDFESANAAAHFDPDKIAIQTGNIISEVWVAQHTGLGASHDEIASADFTMPGLGFRVEGTGRDILTLLGDLGIHRQFVHPQRGCVED